MNNKLEGITLHAEGEANCYRLMRGGNWLATIRMNGELLVWDQEDILRAMLQGQQAAPVADPDCDRSACGDFSPGPCDNLDCPARRSNKAAPVGEREAFEKWLLTTGIPLTDINPYALASWDAWKASAAYQRQQAREVVMPERKECEDGYPSDDWLCACAWNACLDEFARLNKGGIHE